MNERVMIFKISEYKGGPAYCLEHSENVMQELETFVDYAEPEHNLHIEVVMMDREEYHNLDEYDGF